MKVSPAGSSGSVECFRFPSLRCLCGPVVVCDAMQASKSTSIYLLALQQMPADNGCMQRWSDRDGSSLLQFYVRRMNGVIMGILQLITNREADDKLLAT
jgi:hypothetical protein